MGTGFTFVIGGARSGKSSFALKLANSIPGPRAYLATAEARDSEMEERIARHKRERGEGWESLEEPRDLYGTLSGIGGYNVVLIDCFTLWVSNMMEAGAGEDKIVEEAGKIAVLSRKTRASIIAVSNEVGLGLVPETPLGRRFRDIAGLVNQKIAEAADTVFFIASGLPLRLK